MQSNDQMIKALQANPNRWTSADSICEQCNTNSRKVRSAIEHYGEGRISSTSAGYKLTAHLSLKEFSLSDRALASRISKMTNRLRQSRTAYVTSHA